MADKRKNTRAHPDEPMYTDLPKGGRKKLNKKRIDPNPTWKPRGSVSINSQYQPMIGRESSSLNSESETTRLLGRIFTTPVPDERTYQDKDMSLVGNISPRLDLIAKMHHRLGFKSCFGYPSNPKIVSYTEPNLIDLDDPTDSEAIWDVFCLRYQNNACI